MRRIVLFISVCWLVFFVWKNINDVRTNSLPELMIMTADTGESFELSLARRNDESIHYVQMTGEKLQVSGRIDRKHGYFEGEVVWNEKGIYVMDLLTGEGVLLEHDLHSAMIGDYYVSCRYNAEKNEMEILIFDCSQ